MFGIDIEKITNIPFFIYVINKDAGTLSIMTFTIMTLSIMIFRIMTFNIMGLVTTHSINDTQHRHSAYSIECHYAEFHYAQCRSYLNVMLRVVMLNVFC